MKRRDILKSCVMTKGQQTVKLDTLAKILGVPPLIKEDQAKLLEDNKFKKGKNDELGKH